MPHAPPPLEAQTPQMTNAELASHLRTFADDQHKAKRISDKSYDRLRLAADRLESHQRQYAAMRERLRACENHIDALEREANATSHSTGEGEEGFHPG